MSISVKKRSGNVEQLDIEKIHKMVESACDNLSGVSTSEVEMNSGIQFYDGITTNEIQEILVRSASDLISLDNPNYQFVAARLLLYGLYKQVFGSGWKVGFPNVHDHLVGGVSLGIYDGNFSANILWKNGIRLILMFIMTGIYCSPTRALGRLLTSILYKIVVLDLSMRHLSTCTF